MPLTMLKNNEKVFIAMTSHSLAIRTRSRVLVFQATVANMVSYHSNQPYTYFNQVNLHNNNALGIPGNSH